MQQNSEERASDSIAIIYAQLLRIDKKENESQVITYTLHCIDLRKNESFVVEACFAERQPGNDLDFVSLAWEGALVNFINSTISTNDRTLFVQHPDTMIVLEPDYLIDASAIAECFMDRTYNLMLYFLQRCLPSPSSPSMISGILVNQLLDAYLEEECPDFQTVFKQALISNIFTALYIGSEELNRLRRQVTLEHLPVIRNIAALWKDKQKTLEPSFISIDYGLQGRLDVLLEVRSADEEDHPASLLKGGSTKMEDEEDHPASLLKGDNNRDIIELKSSKARDRDVWTNHRMQVVCYHLILRSVYGNSRKGNNYILYSRAPNHPLREVPTSNVWEKQVISVRNAIISKIHAIAFEKDSLLNMNVENFGEFPIFKKDDLVEFQYLVKQLSSIESIYIDKFVQFLFRELWHTKVGVSSQLNKRNYGFSALWKLSKNEKKEDFTIMEGLSFSSIIDNQIIFQVNQDKNVTNFRKGDIVILYPGCADERILLKDQIRKGFIVELSHTQLVLQMKNPGSLQHLLDQYRQWVIEHDFMESGTINMIRGMFNFMRGDKTKRELILGITPPKSLSIQLPDRDDESETIILKALAAQDYFLVQGPPGTGKTSRILTSLVSRILVQTHEHMMILAFTNRAVDEICDRLEQYDIDFIRLGNGMNTKYHYLPQMIQEMTFKEIEELISSTRVFVSTVSSLLSQYQELLRIKNFDTLFVDEASQLLEPHLAGILIHFNRFILIGDQNQLPAVVSQNADELFSADPLFSDLAFHSLHQSLFERLYRRCVEQHWNHAFDMLTNHYRMHSDIENLVNPFYHNRLKANSARQSLEWNKIAATGERIDEILASSRVIFLEVSPNTEFKRSANEARIVDLLLQAIYKQYGDSFDQQKVGVITTWRAQINEIVSHISEPNLIRDVTVDTVERFQGSERDIIIFSTALSAPGQLQIIQSISPDQMVDRKLNVAISRAREQFILLGDALILNQSLQYRRILDLIRIMHGYYVVE